MDNRILPPPCLGGKYDGVFEWKDDLGDGRILLFDVAQQAVCTLSGLSNGICNRFTAFGLQVSSHSTTDFEFVDASRAFSTPRPLAFCPDLVELAAGTGSMGIAASFFGGNPRLCVDHNGLACTLLAHHSHGQVLQRDLLSPDLPLELSHLLGTDSCTFVMGFPCQPLSSQGLMRGQRDPRSLVFWAGLKLAFLANAQALILECVPGADQDPDIQCGIHSFAEAMDFNVCTTILSLDHQWPMRRTRWWALLTPKHWGVNSIPTWPKVDDMSCISCLLHSWGVWDIQHEYQLLLSADEFAHYSDPRYGSDKRFLDLTDVAPTVLHSYGNALSACPCGCRLSKFSTTSLLTKGLRGFFVHSERWNQPRFLHPKELALLLTLPLTFDSPLPVRATLSMLGLVAAPLQMLWVWTHLVKGAGDVGLVSADVDPLSVISNYKAELRRQIMEYFPFASGVEPIALMLSTSPPTHLLRRGVFTLAELARAECFRLDWGEYMRFVGINGLPLSPSCTFEFGNEAPELIVVPKAQALDRPLGLLCIGIQTSAGLLSSTHEAGVFVFQLCWEHDLPSTAFFLDDQDVLVGPDARLWSSVTLTMLSDADLCSLGLSKHEATTRVFRLNDDWVPPGFGRDIDLDHVGMSGGVLWHCLSTVISFAPYMDLKAPALPFALQHGAVLIHPLIALDLLKGRLSARRSEALRTLILAGNGSIACPLLLDCHWVILIGHHRVGNIRWTCLDGLRHDLSKEITCFAKAFGTLLGLRLFEVDFVSFVSQSHSYTCGTIALLHLCIVLGLGSRFSADFVSGLHRHLCQAVVGDTALMGFGPGPTELTQRLAALLETKGVGEGQAMSRAQSCLSKVGVAAVAKALDFKNPWGALKEAASRPGVNFRLVTQEELQAQINAKASSDFGATVPKGKMKKKAQQSKTVSVLQLDPNDLQLDSEHFVDQDGDHIPQISFQDVVADKRGLAICSRQDAISFLNPFRLISADSLALLTTSELDNVDKGAADITSIRFSAIYTPTKEPVILHGSLLQLGDSRIERFVPDSTAMDQLEAVSTSVIKVTAYRDELELPWDTFVTSPVKHLLAIMVPLQLCRGKKCGSDCPYFHAPLEEDLESTVQDVWARRFQKLEGAVCDAKVADTYQVFFRIPESALKIALSIGLIGVYIEPRLADGKGTHPDYAVVWLAGVARNEAAHQVRTYACSINLVRLKARYGVRIRVSDEKDAYEKLRPDLPFVQVRVANKYRLHPIPHGTQRATIIKLLEQWGWKAKPLQPTKGSILGGAWEVGSDAPPPKAVLYGFNQDVMITEVKQKAPQKQVQSVFTSSRTKQVLQQANPASGVSVGSSQAHDVDPWHQSGHDPWNAWKPTASPAKVEYSKSTQGRLQEITEKLSDDVKMQVQQQIGEHQASTSSAIASVTQLSHEAESRFRKLESGLAEVTAQGQQFQGWFKDIGARLSNTEQHVGQMTTQLTQVQAEVHQTTDMVQQSINTGFQSVTCDLDKKLSGMFERFEQAFGSRMPTSGHL